MIRLNHSTGEAILLKPGLNRKFKGLKIPGSFLLKADGKNSEISVHVFKHPLYAITLRQYLFQKTTRIITSELNSWLRVEVPISGKLSIFPRQGEPFIVTSGQYHVTDKAVFACDLNSGTPLIYCTIHFSKELLSGIGTDHPFLPMPPGPVPADLMDMVQDILKCPFQEAVRNFYYANKAREILFSHSVSVSMPVVPPGELRPDQIEQIYEADRIMAHNLDVRITIPELARKLGTNFVTLNRNYEKVFGIGVFQRLMQRRMEHIQLLLEKTNKPLKEIADLAGYESLPGFINAFRKRFKTTPKKWRKERRRL